jgi:tetratricopeptide (TPR) repeat protein
LQDGIARAFARELNLTPAAGTGRAAARETKDLDAYRAYIEGWLKIESLDLDQNPAAIQDFARAIALDPRFARAYTGLATAEFIAYEMNRSTRTPNFQALYSGIEHSRHALQLDPDLADAHAALSFLLTSALQFDEARRAARRAVALDPGDWRHHFRLGHALWGSARLRALEHALELYPHFAYAPLEMAMVQVARNQTGQAMAIAQRGAAEQDRQSATANRYPSVAFHYLLGALRAVAGDYESALSEFDCEVAQAAQHGLYRAEYAASALIWRGHATLALDRVDEAADAFQRALTFIGGHPRALLGLAAVKARRVARAMPSGRARRRARLSPAAGTRTDRRNGCTARRAWPPPRQCRRGRRRAESAAGPGGAVSRWLAPADRSHFCQSARPPSLPGRAGPAGPARGMKSSRDSFFWRLERQGRKTSPG